MADGTFTRTRIVEQAGSSIVPAFGKMMQVAITAPNAGAGQTSFTEQIAELTTQDSVMSIVPTSASAAALTTVRPAITAGVLTVNHASATLAGTETFNVWIWINK